MKYEKVKKKKREKVKEWRRKGGRNHQRSARQATISRNLAIDVSETKYLRSNHCETSEELEVREYFILQRSCNQRYPAAKSSRDLATAHPKTQGLEVMILESCCVLPRLAVILFSVFKNTTLMCTAEVNLSRKASN